MSTRPIDQHCVDTLKNESTSDGIRKILCFFLVDPSQRTVSTAHIGDQQWNHNGGIQLRSSLMTALPLVLVNVIEEYAKTGFTREEALEIRRELMKERKFFVDKHNEVWEREYSLCEH
jgi:hypothetical protein